MNRKDMFRSPVSVDDRFSDKKYLLHSWTGRLMLLCGAIWIIMSVSTGSLLSPKESYIEMLYFLGAKESVSIAQGEWWRFINPIFLHYNILHFGLNMAALKFVGRLVERNTGPVWFLLIFFFAGIQGNIWSAWGNVALGMGASGSVFGLIGFMILPEYLFEWRRFKEVQSVTIHGDIIELTEAKEQKFRWIPGPFSWMGVINIIFALVINFVVSLSDSGSFGIDNAAHMGGLTMGLLLGVAFLLLKENRLIRINKPVGVFLLILAVMFPVGLSGYLMTRPRIKNLLIEDALKTEEPEQSFRKFQRARLLAPEDPLLDFYQGRILLQVKDWTWATEYLAKSAKDPSIWPMLDHLALEMERNQLSDEVSLIRTVLESARGSSL